MSGSLSPNEPPAADPIIDQPPGDDDQAEPASDHSPEPPRTRRPLSPAEEAERATRERQIMARMRQVRRDVALWLVAVSLALLALVVYLMSGEIRTDTAQFDAQLRAVEMELVAARRPIPEVQQLQARLGELDEYRASLDAIGPQPYVDWPAVMDAVLEYDRTQLQLRNLRQTDLQLLLQGTATQDVAVVDYSQQLALSDAIEGVEIRSISQSAPEAGSATETEDETAAARSTGLAAPAPQTRLPATPLGTTVEFVLVIDMVGVPQQQAAPAAAP